MKPGYAEKEKLSKPSPLESNGPRQLNGRPKMPRVDSFSRFSEPPAPPPQQPLPEKPDALPRGGPDAFSPLKRSDTEKPKAGSLNSPVARDSSQILALLESLSMTKREIETQGSRIKELEDLLRQEKAARETAEEKVKMLEMDTSSDKVPSAEDQAVHENLTHPDLNSSTGQENATSASLAEDHGSVPSSEKTGAVDSQEPETSTESQLQERLESMMKQMEEMSKQMASLKDRAEASDQENTTLRKSLAEMIETIRQERQERELAAVAQIKAQPHASDSENTTCPDTVSAREDACDHGSDYLPTDSGDSTSKESDFSQPSTVVALDKRRPYLEATSPYASMLGVVLLGVGLMAYLNGWQKVDK